ncbi:MAG: AMP-binding protein, partial [Mesorhizobium sp.]
AWGLPYSALISGAALVLPGSNLKGDALYSLCERAHVTMSAGVPTVWSSVLDHVQSLGLGFSTLAQLLIGGSSCPGSMIAAFEKQGVAVRHAWGMTELSPLGTVCRTLPKHDRLDADQKLLVRSSQGRPLFGVTLELQDDDAQILPKDGETAGHLMARGHWVIGQYYPHTDPQAASDWFRTGDVATIDADGYLRLMDRSKDVIKSGGEWISSIELENIAMEHPAVAMAACIAEPHEKWGERPLLIIVLRADAHATPEEIMSVFDDRVQRWSRPDRIEFVDEIPLTATGKIQKTELRRIYFGSL